MFVLGYIGLAGISRFFILKRIVLTDDRVMAAGTRPNAISKGAEIDWYPIPCQTRFPVCPAECRPRGADPPERRQRREPAAIQNQIVSMNKQEPGDCFGSCFYKKHILRDACIADIVFPQEAYEFLGGQGL